MDTACAWIVVSLVVLFFPLQAAAENTALPDFPDFAWPVEGKVIDNDDGKRSAASTEGVDILVPEGTEVRASLAGTVIYAGNSVQALGNLILIRHEGGWVTVYGHNSELFVNRGERSGVTEQDLRFILREGAVIPDEAVRDVRVLHRFSFVELDAEQAERAVEFLDGTKLKGREIRLEVARS